MTIGEAIRKARKARGLTLKDLSEQAGVGYNTVYMWEKGFSFPNIMPLISVADALNISLDKLVGREEDDYEGW